MSEAKNESSANGATSNDLLGRDDPDAEIYPCDDCGKMRSKNQGGTVFTVCDSCWDKHFAKRTRT